MLLPVLGQPRPPRWQRSLWARTVPALPADRLFAVWDRLRQLLPSKSLRLRAWVSLMGSLPPPPLTFLFTVSNTQSTSQRAMETSVATESEASCDLWQTDPGWPRQTSDYVAWTRGFPFSQSGPQSGISLQKGRLTGACAGHGMA